MRREPDTLGIVALGVENIWFKHEAIGYGGLPGTHSDEKQFNSSFRGAKTFSSKASALFCGALEGSETVTRTIFLVYAILPFSPMNCETCLGQEADGFDLNCEGKMSKSII